MMMSLFFRRCAGDSEHREDVMKNGKKRLTEFKDRRKLFGSDDDDSEHNRAAKIVKKDYNQGLGQLSDVKYRKKQQSQDAYYF